MVDTTDILIADDQSLLRHSLATVINAEPDLRVVAQAAGGTEAVELTRRHRPALVLMDLRMPDLDGIAATRHLLKTATHDLKVLVLTMFDLDEYVHGALLAGASGFLLKDTDPPRLLDAIRRTVAGESLFAPTVLQRLVEHYVRRPGGRTSVPPGLTDRETEVLTLVGQGRDNHEIAAILHISIKTVKTHIGNLRSKIPARDRAQLVIAAYDAGLVP